MIKERIKDKALRVCDECGHEQWVNYWNMYRKDIHLCRYCSNNKNAKTRISIPWNLGKKFAPKKQGNSYINSNGYREIWLGRNLTKGKSGYYREHKFLKELEIDKKLGVKDLIHHIDGDKTNNLVNNLFVCTGHKQHQNVHAQLERISMELVRANIIQFNHEKGQYFIDPSTREGISKLGELLETPEKDNQQRSFSDMSEEERSTTIQKWSTLK